MVLTIIVNWLQNRKNLNSKEFFLVFIVIKCHMPNMPSVIQQMLTIPLLLGLLQVLLFLFYKTYSRTKAANNHPPGAISLLKQIYF